jgi:hypothetical protein
LRWASTPSPKATAHRCIKGGAGGEGATAAQRSVPEGLAVQVT